MGGGVVEGGVEMGADLMGWVVQVPLVPDVTAEELEQYDRKS